MRSVGLVPGGAVLIEGGVILAAGPRDQVQAHEKAGAARLIDAGGRVVMPGFVDSHAHPVFAGPRLKDYESRLKGRTYAEIAAEGGGILSTVNGVRRASLGSLAPRSGEHGGSCGQRQEPGGARAIDWHCR